MIATKTKPVMEPASSKPLYDSAVVRQAMTVTRENGMVPKAFVVKSNVALGYLRIRRMNAQELSSCEKIMVGTGSVGYEPFGDNGIDFYWNGIRFDFSNKDPAAKVLDKICEFARL
jgi:hypothetical protein